jgi:hypothetical protein
VSDGNVNSQIARNGLISLLVLSLLSLQHVQALPHIYYDDLGLISWRTSWPVAFQEAQQSGKLVFVQITRFPCNISPDFSKKSFPDEKLQKMLRRYCICCVIDFRLLPPDLKQLVTSKGYGEDQCPIHLLLTPQKEALNWAVQSVPPDLLTKHVEQGAADKRMRMSKVQEKEIEKLNPILESAVQSRDARKIQSTWQSIQKIPGNSTAKNKSYDILEKAEEPARKKLLEAAQLLRDQKTPQAQLALDEAKALAESLPVANEIDQTLASLKLYDRALEAERLATNPKQKQQYITLYQQLLSKYPENTVSTLAYQKLRAISLGK